MPVLMCLVGGAVGTEKPKISPTVHFYSAICRGFYCENLGFESRAELEYKQEVDEI